MAGQSLGAGRRDVDAIKSNSPSTGRINATDHVEERRLAGSIWANEGQLLPLSNIHIELLKCQKATKADGQPTAFQQRNTGCDGRVHDRASIRNTRTRRATRPSGCAIKITMTRIAYSRRLYS